MAKWLKVGAKVGLKAAPEVLSVVYPPAAGIVDFLQTQIIQAESDHGAKKGSEKKAQVMKNAHMLMPALLPMLERMAGVDIDDELFMESVSKLIDGLVGVANSMQQLPKGAA